MNTTGDRLAAIDTAYLHVERPGYPIHVGSVATFEAGPLLDNRGRLRLSELQALVDSRLDRLPRMRRRIRWTPLGFDRPHWVDDVHFDVVNHVDVVQARGPGDDEALRRVAMETWSTLLDRSRPLWHLRFVTGLQGDRIGLVERAHHALVDGVSGVDVAAVLLDLYPFADEPAPSTWQPESPAPPPVAAMAGIGARVLDLSKVAARAGTSLMHPSHLACGVRTMSSIAGTLAHDGLAPRSSLNTRTGTERRLAWIRSDLDRAKTAGAAAGATANDVVLAAVAGGLHRLLLLRGERVAENATLNVLMPMSVRSDDEHGALGNRVHGLVVPLPIGLDDARARLDVIAVTTARLKSSGAASATGALLRAADLLPPWTLRLIAPAVHRQPLINLVVTNVPGPPVPLYMLGARMLEAFPIVPLVGNLSVGVAVLSYDGALNLGLTADVETCGDLEVLVDGIERELTALEPRTPRQGTLDPTDGPERLAGSGRPTRR